MGLRAISFRLLFSGLLSVAAHTVEASGGTKAGATSPALTFYSSLSEQPFARLEARALSPRFQAHGPFRVPAPGLAFEAPALALFAEPCAAEDWTRFLHDFAAWRGLPTEAEPLELTLPDGRVFSFAQGPAVSAHQLTGILRPLATAGDDEPASWLLLRIAHDGDRALRLDLRPTPSRTTRPALPARSSAPTAPEPATL